MRRTVPISPSINDSTRSNVVTCSALQLPVPFVRDGCHDALVSVRIGVSRSGVGTHSDYLLPTDENSYTPSVAPSSLTDWFQVALLLINACLVLWYVRMTQGILRTSQAQVEAQIRPALVVMPPSSNAPWALIMNIGSGPAMDVHFRRRPLHAEVDWDAPQDSSMQYVSGFIKAGDAPELGANLEAPELRDENAGKCWQITYRSLSNTHYATMIDFSSTGGLIDTPRFAIRTAESTVPR
jgi:hypothetical protein